MQNIPFAHASVKPAGVEAWVSSPLRCEPTGGEKQHEKESSEEAQPSVL